MREMGKKETLRKRALLTLGSSSGIINKIQEKSILLIAVTLLTFSLGIILSIVSINVEIGFTKENTYEVAFKTIDPTVAFVNVYIRNEAPFEFPGVRSYYFLNVKIDDSSIYSRAYYDDEKLGHQYFPGEIYDFGCIRVTEVRELPIFIENVYEQAGQVNFTIQVYAKILGFPKLIKEEQENFTWQSIPMLYSEKPEDDLIVREILEAYLHRLDLNEIYFDIYKFIPPP